jgi:hypothetical protein
MAVGFSFMEVLLRIVVVRLKRRWQPATATGTRAGDRTRIAIEDDDGRAIEPARQPQVFAG